MNNEERKKIEHLIIQKIEKLKVKIAGYEDMAAPVKPENSIGRISRMDAINNKSVFEASLRKARTELGALQKALFIIDTDDFGICKSCKNEIQWQRIVIKPDSPYCIHCASRLK